MSAESVNRWTIIESICGHLTKIDGQQNSTAKEKLFILIRNNDNFFNQSPHHRDGP